MSLTFTLCAEGSTDELLLPVIDWVISRHTEARFDGRMADPRIFDSHGRNVQSRVGQALRYFPCDILFVHRDADTVPHSERVQEILSTGTAGIVPIVPVRMTEAWFLFNAAAIRAAADNPKSTVALGLPSLRESERRADPKAILDAALVTASEASGRRLKIFRSQLAARKRLVAEKIDDYSPLTRLSSFADFFERTRLALRAVGA